MNIELLYYKTARAEREEIALPEDLVVTFTSPSYALTELVVNVRNGKKEEQIKTKNATVDLSAFCFAGILDMEVFLIVRGKPVKKWVVAPLVLNETDRGFEEFDAITDLQNRVADLERKTRVIM